MYFKQLRKRTITALCLVALGGLFFSGVDVLGQRPGGGGGGGDTGGGTIYFNSSDLAGTGGFAMMNSDGSGKTLLPLRAGEPSRLLHAGHRWFLRLQGIAGETYPDGVERYEIFAYRDDGVSVQLTDDPDLEPAVTVRWQPGDDAMSWTGQRWDSLTGQVVEAGLYEALLVYDEFGDLAGIVPESVGLLLPEPDIGTHDWSPDGSRIVYDLLSTNELRIADLLTGEVYLLYAGPAAQAVWPPDGSTIAFHEAKFLGDILTIKPDGTGLKTILRSHGGKAISVLHPHWSPTGSHLVYLHYDHGQGFENASDVYRARADGSGKTNLTPESDGEGVHAFPVGWR